jgi:DNA-binding MarR family transcriptional regulator
MERNPIMREMNEVFKIFKEKVKKEAKKMGINETNFLVLRYLAKNQGKNITQSNLCEILGQKPSSVSVTVQSMEENGYIKRSKSEKDSRCTLLSLTVEGLNQYNIVKDAFSRVEEIINKSFNSNEVEEIYDYLNRIRKVLGDIL